MPRTDVVVIALKSIQNHLLPQLLPNVVKDYGVVLVLQNGLGIEDTVAQIVPSQTVLGGLCFLCSNKVAPGHIRHLDYGEIKLGEYAPHHQPTGITPQMRLIKCDFERAGIQIELAQNLLLARWQKLVWNIPSNGLSVILNATTHQLMADVHACALVEQIMREVAVAADYCGCHISDSPYRTSMKIDFDEHCPLEVEAIFGYPLRLAQANGANLPLISMLYQQLKFLDRQNCY